MCLQLTDQLTDEHESSPLNLSSSGRHPVATLLKTCPTTRPAVSISSISATTRLQNSASEINPVSSHVPSFC